MNALLDAFIRYMPTAAEEPPVEAKNAKTGAEVTITPDPAGPLVARVFKTAADPFVGRLTYLRVLSGTLHGQAHAWNANRDEDERIGQLLLLHGKDQEPIGELQAGEIGAVAKLAATETGDTLSSKRAPDHPAAARLPGADAVGRDRAPDEGRPRQDGRGPPADARGGAVGAGRAVARPASSSSSRWARPTSRSSASG